MSRNEKLEEMKNERNVGEKKENEGKYKNEGKNEKTT